MTTSEAATKIGCDTSHVRRLLRAGKIKGKRKANSFTFEWVINKASVNQYLTRTAKLSEEGRLRGWKRGKSRKPS